MPVLVTGAKGMLGTDLCAAFAAHGTPVVGIDIQEANLLSREETFEVFHDVKPVIVVHTAAYTRVDDAEGDVDAAWRVNGEASLNVGNAAAEVGAMVVAISTDYVYDGRKNGPYREDDPVNPLGVYGRTKLEGERLLAEACPRHVILRTEWLFGNNGPNFVKTILRLADERPFLEVVTDQIGAPTYTGDLAEGIVKVALGLMENPDPARFGVCHLTASGECSWFDFACRILKIAGKSTEVRPTTSEKFRRPAPRPANSVLDCSRIERLFGIRLPSWKDGLKRYFQEQL